MGLSCCKWSRLTLLPSGFPPRPHPCPPTSPTPGTGFHLWMYIRMSDGVVFLLPFKELNTCLHISKRIPGHAAVFSLDPPQGPRSTVTALHRESSRLPLGADNGPETGYNPKMPSENKREIPLYTEDRQLSKEPSSSPVQHFQVKHGKNEAQKDQRTCPR